MNFRHLLNGLTLFFAFAGAALAVDAFFTYLDLWKPAAVTLTPPPAPPANPGQKPSALDYSVIVRRDLFAPDAPPVRPSSQAQAEPPRVAPPPAPVPSPPAAPPQEPVSAKFRLVGTTVFPGGGGYAILEDLASKQQSVHRQGDTVQGATVESVKRGEIRLMTGGRAETLTIFEEREEKEKGGPGRPASPGPGASQGPASSLVPNPRAEGNGSAVRLPRAQVARVVGQARSYFRTEPYGLPGGVAGVRVYPLQAGVFHILGFQPGDVVLAIDGKAVKTEAELFAAMGQVLERGGSAVEVLRGGSKLSLAFQVQ